MQTASLRARGAGGAPLRAVLFDLDGVVTRTATLHSAAWKETFDAFLAARAQAQGTGWEPFVVERDYPPYVDGRRRYDGVDTFLRSRGVELPWGDPSDGPDEPTVCGLGNRKQARFVQIVAERPAEVFDDAVDLVRALRAGGTAVAVVSASENCWPLLRTAGLADLFDTGITGVEAAAADLPGKPAPDTFLRAAADLGVEPALAAVVEDAITGVRAGRAGGFGLVVGVDRVGAAAELAAAGADVVVSDLRDLLRG